MGEPLTIHGLARGAEKRARVVQALVLRFVPKPSPKRRRVGEGHEVACVLYST